MNRRQRRRQERRVEMLDKAMQIVVEQGLEALTIARLADALDAAVGGLYRYFPSKQALLAALQMQAIEQFYDDLQEELKRVDEELQARGINHQEDNIALLYRLKIPVRFFLADATKAPDRHRLMDALISSPQVLLGDDEIAEVNKSLFPILEIVGNMLGQAGNQGALNKGDIAQRTHIIWATVHGMDHFRKRDRIHPQKLKVDTMIEANLHALMIGWGANPEDIDKIIAFEANLKAEPEA